MNNELCFVVNGENLYLDKVLVAFNEIPIFFVCIDKKDNYYLVLCLDTEQMTYLVLKSSISDIWKMLTQRKTMRDTILHGSIFWMIESGNTPEDDSIEPIKKESIDDDVLPFEGAFYEKVYEEDELYIEHIDSQYLSGMQFDMVDSLTECVNSITEQIADQMNTIAESIENIVEYLDFSSSNKISHVFSEEEKTARSSISYVENNVTSNNPCWISSQIDVESFESNAVSLAA